MKVEILRYQSEHQINVKFMCVRTETKKKGRYAEITPQ
jgi:hypothetical protein